MLFSQHVIRVLFAILEMISSNVIECHRMLQACIIVYHDGFVSWLASDPPVRLTPAGGGSQSSEGGPARRQSRVHPRLARGLLLQRRRRVGTARAAGGRGARGRPAAAAVPGAGDGGGAVPAAAGRGGGGTVTRHHPRAPAPAPGQSVPADAVRVHRWRK